MRVKRVDETIIDTIDCFYNCVSATVSAIVVATMNGLITIRKTINGHCGFSSTHKNHAKLCSNRSLVNGLEQPL